MSFWPVDGILFHEHPFSSSSNNHLKWQRSISLCTCAPSPKCLDGSAPHIRHSRHHNLIKRNPGVKIRSAFSATYCAPAIPTKPSDLVQVLWNLQLWNFPENHSKLFQSKFHCCNIDAKSSALFLEVRDPWWDHSARLLWSYDWMRLCLASTLHFLKVMAAVLRCLKKHCLLHQST